MKKQIAALLLAISFLLIGCQSGEKRGEIARPSVTVTEEAAAVTDFAVDMLQELNAGKSNVMVSPVSILSALAMTANGAKGNTLTQMEAAFGLSVAEINEYFGEYVKNLPSSPKSKLNMANSIWLLDKNVTLLDEFVDVNKEHYNARIEQVSFGSAEKTVNRWVEQKTDRMIKDLIPAGGLTGASMALVNAVAFDAQWDEKYEEDDVKDWTFTTVSGEKVTVDMMFSEESLYLIDENAVGFMKYYKDQKYAFVALLPNEDVSLSQYLDTLTGEKLQEILSSLRETKVKAGLPKFTSEYSQELTGTLTEMGIEDAFGPADFSGINGSGGIFISKVYHKTYIDVNESGTKAAAATAVVMTSSAPRQLDTVYLTRPFLYMIVDCEQLLPVFAGTVTNL